MCTYNVMIEDEIADRLRSSFKDDTSMENWIQKQLTVLVLKHISESKNKARTLRELCSSFGCDLSDVDAEDLRAHRTFNRDIETW